MKTRFPISLTLLATLILSVWASSRTLSAEIDTVTTITLRSTVRLNSDDESLTLGDIAEISGPQSVLLNQLTIDSTKPIVAGKWVEVEIRTLRTRLEHAPSINIGSIILIGNDISITRRAETTQPTPTTTPTHSAATTHEGPILKDHLKRWIYTRLRTQPDTTRIKFDKRDLKLLSTPTSDRVVEITETGRSSKVILRVTIYENDQIVTDTTLRIDVQLQRSVRVATRQINRREVIDAQMCMVESRWLSPVLAIAEPNDALGLESKTTIKPGEIILSSMLTQRILVKRGQLVSAKSLVGQAIVTKTVRALESGKMGDLIELESKDHKSNFIARIAGPGRVVIVEKSKNIAQLNPIHSK